MEYGTLYILGAGASIGAKLIPKNRHKLKSRMPSGPNFFYDCGLFDAPKDPEHEFFNIIPFMYEGLNQIIEKSWRLDSEIQTFTKEEWKGVNVEEVFTFLDTGEKLYHKNSNVYKAFKSAKKSLIDYICIEISLRSLGQRCEYLARLFKNLSERDSILCFNWDTITETTLEYLNSPHYENYLNLCGDNKFKISEYSNKCLLLKLHGSINWMICTNSECPMHKKNQLILNKKSNMLRDLRLGDFEKCESCERSFIENTRNIIPPTSNKIAIHQDSYMHRLWLLAREKLRFSKRLVFIGYSFPTTDFYSEWLFRQINFLQHHDGNTAVMDVDVVNPEIFDKRSTTYSRYNTIFRGHRIRKYKNLSEYVNKVA